MTPDAGSSGATPGRPSIVLNSAQAAQYRDGQTNSGKHRPRASLSIKQRNLLGLLHGAQQEPVVHVPEVTSSTTGEDLGYSVGAGISSSVPKKPLDFETSGGSASTNDNNASAAAGSAKRMVAWLAKRSLKRQQEIHFSFFDKPPAWAADQFPYSSNKQEEPEVLHHMRVHRGVIDPRAVTSMPPGELFQHVLQTLEELGLVIAKTQELRIRVHRPALSALGNANKQSISVVLSPSQNGDPTHEASQSSSWQRSADTQIESKGHRSLVSQENSSEPRRAHKPDATTVAATATVTEKRVIGVGRAPVESPAMKKPPLPPQSTQKGRQQGARLRVSSKIGAFKRFFGFGGGANSGRPQLSNAKNSGSLNGTLRKDSGLEIEPSPSTTHQVNQKDLLIEEEGATAATSSAKRRVVSGSYVPLDTQADVDALQGMQRAGTTARRNTMNVRRPLAALANEASSSAPATQNVSASASVILPSVPENTVVKTESESQSGSGQATRGMSPSTARPVTAGSSFSATSSLSPDLIHDRGHHQQPLRMSISASDSSGSNNNGALRSVLEKGKIPPYGEPNVDNGDEIQFIAEICKVKHLP
ncbi:hypothetical protein EV182_004952, partial [Spiromyces aspiralis]